MAISREEIEQIATRTADELMEQISLEREERELRDHIIGGAMGEGAIPLYGRETRKEPCRGCRIDPAKPLEAGNVMATTNNAIGTLAPDEVRNWCSEIIEVADGRCQRARAIKEAARECKERYPEDTAKFFECYAPAFSKITKGDNPGAKEPWQMTKEEFVKIYIDRFRGMLSKEALSQVTEEEFQNKRQEAIEYQRHTIEQALRVGRPVPLEVLRDYPDLQKESNPGEYITITNPGNTTFKPGEVVSREAFEKENERVKKLGEKPAMGEYGEPGAD